MLVSPSNSRFVRAADRSVPGASEGGCGGEMAVFENKVDHTEAIGVHSALAAAPRAKSQHACWFNWIIADGLGGVKSGVLCHEFHELTRIFVS